jgi:hypothetical protein
VKQNFADAFMSVGMVVAKLNRNTLAADAPFE